MLADGMPPATCTVVYPFFGPAMLSSTHMSCLCPVVKHAQLSMTIGASCWHCHFDYLLQQNCQLQIGKCVITSVCLMLSKGIELLHRSCCCCLGLMYSPACCYCYSAQKWPQYEGQHVSACHWPRPGATASLSAELAFLPFGPSHHRCVMDTVHYMCQMICT